MKKNTTSKRGPGRPMAEINIPSRKFTFADLAEANKHVTPLTLRKFLKRDLLRKSRSEVILVKNETREPVSKNGLGRKTFVYIKRSRQTALKAANKVSVDIGTPKTTKPTKPTNATADYEATKAALLASTPDSTVSVNEVTPELVTA